MKKLLALCVLGLVAGCSNQEKYSFETVEDARGQARENAKHNAKVYRDKNYPDFKIIVRGDSSITSTCPQGDGWASVEIKKGNQHGELKCSTVSGSIGCLKKKDFQASEQYSTREGRCDREIPHPLPKILK